MERSDGHHRAENSYLEVLNQKNTLNILKPYTPHFPSSSSFLIYVESGIFFFFFFFGGGVGV